MAFSRWLLGFTLLAAPVCAQSPLSAPTTPTAPTTDNSTLKASTAFVQTLIAQVRAAFAPSSDPAKNDPNVVASTNQVQKLAYALGRYPGNWISDSPFPSVADPTDSTVLMSGWPAGDPASNFTNKLSLVFGSANSASSTNCAGCLIVNRTQLDQHVEHNQINGTAGTNGDGSYNDGKSANPTAFSAIFRSFPEGDAFDTSVMLPDGLHLRAHCQTDFGMTCPGQANIVTGMIRPETAIYPGDVVETCMQRPGSAYTAAWLTTWLLGGRYPAAGSAPNASLFKNYYYGSGIFPVRPQNYIEIDFPDGFPIYDQTAAHFDLTPSMPVIDGKTAIQNVGEFFQANSGPFIAIPNAQVSWAPQYTDSHTVVDQSLAVHCFQVELVPTVYSDTARTVVTTRGHVVYSMDGQEYNDAYDNWNGGAEVDWNGNVLPGNLVPAAAIMVGLQPGPLSSPIASAAMTRPNVEGMDGRIVSLRAWHRIAGAHVVPSYVNAVPQPGLTIAQRTGALYTATPQGPTYIDGTNIGVTGAGLQFKVDAGAYAPVLGYTSATGNTNFEVLLPVNVFSVGSHTLTMKNSAGDVAPSITVVSANSAVAAPNVSNYVVAVNNNANSFLVKVEERTDGTAARDTLVTYRLASGSATNDAVAGANTACGIAPAVLTPSSAQVTCAGLAANTGYTVLAFQENQGGFGPVYGYSTSTTP